MDKKCEEEDKIFERIKQDYEKIVEKNFYYKLKRWEINLMKKLRAFLSNFKFIIAQKEEIKKQNEQLNEEIKKENEKFKEEKEQIIQAKNQEIKNIEINKEKKIEENNNKYKTLFARLDLIKNDKQKLIEFLNSNFLL